MDWQSTFNLITVTGMQDPGKRLELQQRRDAELKARTVR
jgi:hypothetical protein